MAKETLTPRQCRSGGEWEVVNAKGVVMASGFDDEEEAETWAKDTKLRKAK